MTFSSGEPASPFAPVSTLIPGMIPWLSSSFGNGVPSAELLADRLVVEDHARDVVARALRREEGRGRRVRLLGGLDSDRVEPLLDRARALVRGEDALALGDERACGAFEVCCAMSILSGSLLLPTSIIPAPRKSSEPGDLGPPAE